MLIRAQGCIFAEYKGFITPVYGGGCAAVGYFVNRYMNPYINKYFGQFGAAVPNNAYGLSEMVQFIWRSAI